MPFTNYSNGKISIITLEQTRLSPLSLFYLLLQIQGHVNRLQSIWKEPYIHNRVGVRNILQCKRLSKQEMLEKGTATSRELLQVLLYADVKIGERSSCHPELEQ